MPVLLEAMMTEFSGRYLKDVVIADGATGLPISAAHPLPVQLTTTPTITIGEVQILGDDAATIAGTKADAASTATDTTAVTWTQVFKQISKSIQALVTANHTDMIAATPAGENHVGEVGGRNALVVGTFTRPANTTAYASGQLVANSTTTVSVTAITMTIGRGASGVAATGMIRRARLRKTGTSTSGASFRLHFFNANPFTTTTVTYTVGSNLVNWTAHGLATGCPVQITTAGGSPPTGVSQSTTYYVIYNDANSFKLATSNANAYAGTNLSMSGSATGTSTGYAGNSAGDGSAILVGLNLNYVGKIDVTVDQTWADGASGNGTPAIGSEINFTTQNYYCLVEARGAYTPISGEVFGIELEVLQN